MRNRNWGNKIANEAVNKIYAGGAANRGGGGGGVRTWLVIEKGGKCETVEVGKHAIMKRAGLPARDLRMLEPALSYPSTILGRERAIVFNVEHIKAIITCSEILLLNSRDPAVSPFARTLVQRLSPSPSLRPAFHEHGMNDEMEGANPASRSPQSEINEHSEGGFSRDHLTTALEGFGNRNLNVLPFEFRALEACLEESCNCLERETTTLEQEAYPALDELTTTISTLNLERVRQIKSRLVAVSGRIQKVRDELEHLLDDDGDMAEMYLTNKMLQQQLDEEFSSYSFNLNKVENHSSQLDMANGSEHAGDDEKDNDSDSAASSSHQSSHSDDDSGSKHFNVEELEMLLEAYFVQIDGTLNKLSALREYVDDTEDYINIMLDDKQNQLLRMGVMLSTINLLINCCIVVVGVFGMNIHVQLFEREHAGLLQFVTTVCGSFGGGVIMYCCAIGWYRKRGLLG